MLRNVRNSVKGIKAFCRSVLSMQVSHTTAKRIDANMQTASQRANFRTENPIVTRTPQPSAALLLSKGGGIFLFGSNGIVWCCLSNSLGLITPWMMTWARISNWIVSTLRIECSYSTLFGGSSTQCSQTSLPLSLTI